MKTTFFFLFFLTNSCFTQIYEGTSFPNYKLYITDINEPNIIVEIGGSNLKMSDDYVILKKDVSKKSDIKSIEIIANSYDSDTYLFKRSNNLYLKYNESGVNRTYKIRKVDYTDEIDKIRFNIFEINTIRNSKESNTVEHKSPKEELTRDELKIRKDKEVELRQQLIKDIDNKFELFKKNPFEYVSKEFNHN
jgi:hypothetical protein